MKKAFADTSLVEAKGHRSSSESAICFLDNENVSMAEKARFVENALNGDSPLEHAPAIASWLDIAQPEEGWVGEEAAYWSRIKANERARNLFLQLAGSIGNLPTIEMSLYRFARRLRWISEDDLASQLSRIITSFFADKKIKIEERDLLCGERLSAKIDYRSLGIVEMDLPMAMSLACLGNMDSTIVNVFVKYAKSPNEEEQSFAMAGLAMAVISHGFRNIDPKSIEEAIPGARDKGVRQGFINILSILQKK